MEQVVACRAALLTSSATILFGEELQKDKEAKRQARKLGGQSCLISFSRLAICYILFAYDLDNFYANDVMLM